MSARWGRAAVVSTLLACLCWCPGLSADYSIKASMGDKNICEEYSDKIQWISGKTSALISGKTEDTIAGCQFKFGLATQQASARLRLNFEFFYIHDCGVELQINESVVSDFAHDKSNKEIFLSGCNTKNPGPLYAQPKNFVLITLKKENRNMEGYNFRLNISMAEELPRSGPDLHVVIIIGFVLVVVVITAGILIFKYVTRLSYSWREQRAEEAMERAINIYNHLEHQEEPDLVYLTPGGQVSQGGQHPATARPTGPEIAFVHSDGRVERFRPRDGPGVERRATQPNRNTKPSSNHPKTRRHSHEPRIARCYLSGDELSSQSQPSNLDSGSAGARGGPRLDTGDTASLGGCDMPPSYEEALEMPAPRRAGGDVEGVEEEDEEEDNVAVGGRLELDYMNIGRDEQEGSNLRQQVDFEEDNPEGCGSGEVLLAFHDRDKHK